MYMYIVTAESEEESGYIYCSQFAHTLEDAQTLAEKLKTEVALDMMKPYPIKPHDCQVYISKIDAIIPAPDAYYIWAAKQGYMWKRIAYKIHENDCQEFAECGFCEHTG